MTSSQRLLKKKAVKAQKLRWRISAARVAAEKAAKTARAAKAEYKTARKAFKHAKKAAKEARRQLKALIHKLNKVRSPGTKVTQSNPRVLTAAKSAETSAA